MRRHLYNSNLILRHILSHIHLPVRIVPYRSVLLTSSLLTYCPPFYILILSIAFVKINHIEASWMELTKEALTNTAELFTSKLWFR